MRFTFRKQYDEKSELAAGERNGTPNNEASLTQQQYTNDVNLNVMVRRMGITDGAIPPAAFDPELYGDFGDAIDLRDLFDRVRAAQEMFRELPADIKNRFANDPARMIDFIQDPKNAEEAVKLGLLAQEKLPEPVLGTRENPIITAPAVPPATTATPSQ